MRFVLSSVVVVCLVPKKSISHFNIECAAKFTTALHALCTSFTTAFDAVKIVDKKVQRSWMVQVAIQLLLVLFPVNMRIKSVAFLC